MNKIDALTIVHSEREGLFSVGNSERARCGMVARESVIRLPVIPVIYKSRVPAFIQYSFNTFNLKFPKEADPASYQRHYQCDAFNERGKGKREGCTKWRE